MGPTIGKSGWVRPESMHVLGFAILCLLFTLGGLAVWRHRRRFMRGPMATVLFLIAICYGFAVGSWVVDAIGIYEPYASETPVRAEFATVARNGLGMRCLGACPAPMGSTSVNG